VRLTRQYLCIQYDVQLVSAVERLSQLHARCFTPVHSLKLSDSGNLHHVHQR